MYLLYMSIWLYPQSAREDFLSANNSVYANICRDKRAYRLLDYCSFAASYANPGEDDVIGHLRVWLDVGRW